MNELGSALRLSLFGDSHGEAIGAVVDGYPAGLEVAVEEIQRYLDRRRPGAGPVSSPRREADRVRVVSGVIEGRATGAPILLYISNADADSAAYDGLRWVPRPGHADLSHHVKYEGFRDHRGGGHTSGRLTAPLVAAGALAHAALGGLGIEVMAQTARIADVTAPPDAGFADRWDNPVRCGDAAAAIRMEQAIAAARRERDSVGGIVRCRVEGLPIGLGEPRFDAVEAVLAHALMALPASRGIEFGAGFAAAAMRGSEHNDPIVPSAAGAVVRGEHGGGVAGGLTDGGPLELKLAFKPTPSIARPQASVDLRTGEAVELRLAGRHDPCVVPRAVPVVECLSAFVLLDLVLRDRTWPPRLRGRAASATAAVAGPSRDVGTRVCDEVTGGAKSTHPFGFFL